MSCLYSLGLRKRNCVIPSLLSVTISLKIVMVFLLSVAHSAVDPRQVDGKTLFQSLMASHCSVSCIAKKPRPVCGTNDITYASRCELKRARKCDGLRIKVKHKYPCPSGTALGSPCLKERRNALKLREKGNKVLVPTCKIDGSFNEMQCHVSTRYCWCVTQDGRHIPNTSVKGKRPNCRGRRRRRRGKKSKKRKHCSNKDRHSFNTEMIKVFKEEYIRVHPTQQSQKADPDKFASEKTIVLWKFTELDINKDDILKYKELRNFVRIVKKLIKPRACAKRFAKTCDKNKDRKIEQTEWTMCLGVDIKLSFRMFISLNSAGQDHDAGSQSEARKLSPLDRFATGLASLQPINTKNPLSNLQSHDHDSGSPVSPLEQSERADASMDCRKQREEMVHHSQEPDSKHYIPACKPNGLWERAQCHHARGYCWCVEETTGNPIAGTAAFRVKPNCTFENDREMKGCPFEQKRRFLVDLIGELTEEWKKAMGNKTSTPRDTRTLREAVARWKLKMLDANNNGMLERSEWKTMRRTTLKQKHFPRKCRRNFVRYCDEDNSKKITLEEWKSCLGLNEYHMNSLPLNPERRGKNPFVDQLT